MTDFTVRVELHSADSGDYDALHGEMDREGFERTITGTDNKGVWHTWHLPWAEYIISGDFTCDHVRRKAISAAERTAKKYAILVTQAQTRCWIGLDLV